MKLSYKSKYLISDYPVHLMMYQTVCLIYNLLSQFEKTTWFLFIRSKVSTFFNSKKCSMKTWKFENLKIWKLENLKIWKLSKLWYAVFQTGNSLRFATPCLRIYQFRLSPSKEIKTVLSKSFRFYYLSRSMSPGCKRSCTDQLMRKY